MRRRYTRSKVPELIGFKNIIRILNSFTQKLHKKKKKNKIQRINDENGRWMENEGEVENEFCFYFVNLFNATLKITCVLPLLGYILKFSNEMNEELEQPFI